MKPLSAALLALVSRASSQHVVQFAVTKGPAFHGGAAPPSLARRGAYPERLINSVSGGGYYVEVEVGTPAQTLTMLLDTGSSDAWVLGHDADLCTSRDLQDLYGVSCTDTYDPSKSSTNKMIQPDGFKIVYLDGGSASGDYMSDRLVIDGATIQSLQMAYVTRAVRGTGVLGLGFSISERAAAKYPNIIDQMANQGLIGCKAYSLYLNDRRTDSGSILFGGIDTDKFIGPLHVLPLYKAPGGNYSSFEVNFTSVAVTYNNGTELVIPTSILSYSAPAVLDSGTTFTYLPDEMAQPIFTALGAVYDPDLHTTLISCKPPIPFNLTFTFPTTPPNPSMTITIPLHELLLDLLPPNYPPPSGLPKQQKPCILAIQSTALLSPTLKSPAHFALLGDTFLRSAYVVYDRTSNPKRPPFQPQKVPFPTS